MTEILKNPEYLKEFTKFCEREYSLENLLAYLEIQAFKQQKKEPIVIFETFFSGSSALFEVNIQMSVSNAIKNKLDKNEFDLTLFDDVERTVMSNL